MNSLRQPGDRIHSGSLVEVADPMTTMTSFSMTASGWSSADSRQRFRNVGCQRGPNANTVNKARHSRVSLHFFLLLPVLSRRRSQQICCQTAFGQITLPDAARVSSDEFNGIDNLSDHTSRMPGGLDFSINSRAAVRVSGTAYGSHDWKMSHDIGLSNPMIDRSSGITMPFLCKSARCPSHIVVTATTAVGEALVEAMKAARVSSLLIRSIE